MGGRTQHLQATPSPGPDHTAGLPSKMRVERRASVRHPLNEHKGLTIMDARWYCLCLHVRCKGRLGMRMPLLISGFVVAVVGTLLAAGFRTEPASALIHEIVSAQCSNLVSHNHDPQDPPGAGKFEGPGKSAISALLHTGVLTLVFGEDPQGNQNESFITIVFTDKPPAKFSWDGSSYTSFPDEEGNTIFFPVLVPDHPSFEHCPNVSFEEEG